MASKSHKGRKIGRNKKRPSQMVYTMAKRWVTNQAKCMKRHARRMAKKAIRRIQWEARTQRRHLHSSEAERILQLRHVVSQNLTG
jgi:hypothetical protein